MIFLFFFCCFRSLLLNSHLTHVAFPFSFCSRQHSKSKRASSHFRHHEALRVPRPSPLRIGLCGPRSLHLQQQVREPPIILPPIIGPEDGGYQRRRSVVVCLPLARHGGVGHAHQGESGLYGEHHWTERWAVLLCLCSRGERVCRAHKAQGAHAVHFVRHSRSVFEISFPSLLEESSANRVGLVCPRVGGIERGGAAARALRLADVCMNVALRRKVTFEPSPRLSPSLAPSELSVEGKPSCKGSNTQTKTGR